MGAPIPAVCDNCGRLLIAPQIFGVEGGGSVELTLENVSVSPCPHCGGTGRVPSGVYRLTANTVRYLGAPEVSAEDLRVLRNLLMHARERDATPAEVAHEIEEAVPATAPLAQEVGQQSGAAFRAWLVIVIALIGVLLQAYSTFGPGQERPALTEQQIERAMEQAIRAAAERTPPEEQVMKVGRNDPCPCGSGKKYKHCHGK